MSYYSNLVLTITPIGAIYGEMLKKYFEKISKLFMDVCLPPYTRIL
jgi:hypothetical protein